MQVRDDLLRGFKATGAQSSGIVVENQRRWLDCSQRIE